MQEQMTLFDWAKYDEQSKQAQDEIMNVKRQQNRENVIRPQCYDCRHQIRRGYFRLCQIGGAGYKKIGIRTQCTKFEAIPVE